MTVPSIPNYDAWKLASPPEPPIYEGTISRTLREGIYAEEEVEIDYVLQCCLEIESARIALTGAEIDPDDILEYDRERLIEDIKERQSEFPGNGY